MEATLEREQYLSRGSLWVDRVLAEFLDAEALPGTGIEPERFWADFSEFIHDLSPRSVELLEVRARLQAAIDRWHRDHPGQPDPQAYRAFLEEIGYLVPAGAPFNIATGGVDLEISSVAGPQLVVPVTNARYALNAANARWGSLYDALYGTDAILDPPQQGPYDPARGADVIRWARRFLDDCAPLRTGSHADSVNYLVDDGALVVRSADGPDSGLADAASFVGYIGAAEAPSRVLISHHGLGIEIVFDADHSVGRTDQASIADVRLESAVTAIMDCEDSVATVDGGDKTAAYRNWLGLMRGTLQESVTKHGRTFARSLAPDREFNTPEGKTCATPGGH